MTYDISKQKEGMVLENKQTNKDLLQEEEKIAAQVRKNSKKRLKSSFSLFSSDFWLYYYIGIWFVLNLVKALWELDS
uniref:Uncharacterized protein n=1 Tax=Anolis carolinensis TaxID=28377 RepID=A0A803TVB3_ANOCA